MSADRRRSSALRSSHCQGVEDVPDAFEAVAYSNDVQQPTAPQGSETNSIKPMSSRADFLQPTCLGLGAKGSVVGHLTRLVIMKPLRRRRGSVPMASAAHVYQLLIVRLACWPLPRGGE